MTGDAATKDQIRYDIAVLSPGIEETAPLVVNVTSKQTPLIGELELAFTLATTPVVAITGTNGKTTTTELTARMLRGAGIRAEACGNIGTPMSELLLADEPELYIAEVSSFQLETIRSFRPKVALWLNLSPNHLDRYPSMVEYREAKLRVFLNQTESDWAVIQHGSELPPLKARCITFSVTDPSADITLTEGTRIFHAGKLLLDIESSRLRGPHNASNLMAAFGAGIALGADPVAMACSVGDYSPPSHRCEVVAVKRGITWINDSKATNLAAMEQAIRSVNGPLVLIAGGKDKGFEFSPIAPLVRERVSRSILIGEMRHRIARDWSPAAVEVTDTLDEAIAVAADSTPPGGTVLFSPGTSSFDMFRDYVRRGEEFRRIVLSLADIPRNED